MSESWTFRGIMVPEGEPTELHVVAARLADAPRAGADVLPGRYVLAGLVDAHVHLSLDFSALGLPAGHADLLAANRGAHLRAGVLLARDVGAPPGVRVGGDHPDGPVVLAAGRFLAPGNGYLPGLFEPVAAEALVATAMHELDHSDGWVKLVFDFPEHVAGPESFFDARPNYDIDLLAELCSAVHARGCRVAAHVSGPGDSSLAVAVGVDSIEHGVDVVDDDLAALGRRRGAWTPTLTTVLGLVHGSARGRELRERMGHLLAVADRSGVQVLAGTDGTPHGSLADEIVLLTECGMAPDRALAAASCDARSYLGRAGFVAGSLADLVTYDDDPRDDPAVLRRPAAIVRAGRRIR